VFISQDGRQNFKKKESAKNIEITQKIQENKQKKIKSRISPNTLTLGKL